MWTHSETIPLPASVFTILRDLVHEQTGLYYDSNKAGLLAEKLSPRVFEHRFHSFLDYYYLLKYGPNSEREWPHVLDCLSVPETYFWRESAQVEAFVSGILPQYVAQHRPASLGIWCAACATGEEPLTIAMALNEAGWFERMPVAITATDASPSAIAKAGQGIYRERSFRVLREALRDKYFRKTDSGWQVDPELSRHVQFARANLASPETASRYGRVPFIFCRNVFIYFSDESMVRTVKSFARDMLRPGYLFVGASESLLRVSTDFALEAAGEAFTYVLR